MTDALDVRMALAVRLARITSAVCTPESIADAIVAGVEPVVTALEAAVFDPLGTGCMRADCDAAAVARIVVGPGGVALDLCGVHALTAGFIDGGPASHT